MLLFVLLHLAALLFDWRGLMLTIPLHLIYGLIARRMPRPDQGNQMNCPQCAELVSRQARKCKHCGARLSPAQQSFMEARARRD